MTNIKLPVDAFENLKKQLREEYER